jgi:formate-dependent nitrite reductase membrane component NrfD
VFSLMFSLNFLHIAWMSFGFKGLSYIVFLLSLVRIIKNQICNDIMKACVNEAQVRGHSIVLIITILVCLYSTVTSFLCLLCTHEVLM